MAQRASHCPRKLDKSHSVRVPLLSAGTRNAGIFWPISIIRWTSLVVIWRACSDLKYGEAALLLTCNNSGMARALPVDGGRKATGGECGRGSPRCLPPAGPFALPGALMGMISAVMLERGTGTIGSDPTRTEHYGQDIGDINSQYQYSVGPDFGECLLSGFRNNSEGVDGKARWKWRCDGQGVRAELTLGDEGKAACCEDTVETETMTALNQPGVGMTENIQREFGGPCRGRTYGPLIKSQLLYQLS